jgi:hypothetical protein
MDRNPIYIYKQLIKKISKVILAIFVLGIFPIILSLQLPKQLEITFICIGFALEIIFLPHLLEALIINSIALKNDIKILFAFSTNLLLMHHSTTFIFYSIYNKYNENIMFQIATIIVLIIVIIRVCKIIKIPKNSNFSFLKSINLFFVAGITVVIYILRINKFSNLLTTENTFNFYFLLPFLLTRGMYELLDGRAKDA